MPRFRRLVVSVGAAASLISAATVVTVGASGGFGFNAGTFTFTETSAFVSAFNPVDQSSLDLNVDRGTFMFRQRPGGAIQSSFMTTLSITQFIPNPDPTPGPAGGIGVRRLGVCPDYSSSSEPYLSHACSGLPGD